MDLLRVYLLAGLISHKAYWEYMKRGSSIPAATNTPPLRVRMVKAVKIAVLAGIIVQTLIPWTVLPLTEEPSGAIAAGVALFTAGLAIAITGRAQLGRNWADIETPTRVARPALVTRGLYRFIRHPIYTGDMLLLVGLQLSLNSWLVLAALLMIPAVMVQATLEERLLAHRLDGYEEYCRRTKRFVPFVA